MFLLFFIVWIILNGRLTVEIAVLGLIISALLYLFICKFMGHSYKKDIFVIRKSKYIVAYLAVLFVEIVKANLAVIKLVFSSKYENEPALITFQVDLKTKGARVLLANAITLTPGTITVSLEENEYKVHCLDKELAQGIEASVFIPLLQKMEAPITKKQKEEKNHA